MDEHLRQNIRGGLALIPLIVIVTLLAIIARPRRVDTEVVVREMAEDVKDVVAAVGDSTSICAPELHPFDPNTADYHALVAAGVERRIAVSIIRWREAGKVYRIKEDIALCYGMTDSIYTILEPYIVISDEHRIKSYRTSDTTYSHKYERDDRSKRTIVYTPFRIDTATADYLRTIGFSVRQAELIIRYGEMIGGYRSIEEFEECYAVDSTMAATLKPYIIFPERDTTHISFKRAQHESIDVNSADSAALVALPGIGPKSVVHILRYRDLLGGYYDISQILELDIVTSDNFQLFSSQIYCDNSKIEKIYINFARPKELEVHPYLSNRMLRRIINHRELKGGWSTIEEMIDSKIFNQEEAARIAPYLDFGTKPQE